MSLARKILLVDDAPDPLDMTREALSALPYQVVMATAGQDAIRAALREHPDLVIMKATLPDLAAAEVVSRIRNMPGLRSVPVLLVASGSDDPALQHCMKMGLSDYVTRPVDVSLLLRKTAKALGLAERKNVSFLVRLDHRGASSFARAADLSASGIRIESALELVTGDEVTLQFFVPGSRTRLQLAASVVREVAASASAEKGYGLRFLDLPESARGLIASSMLLRG